MYTPEEKPKDNKCGTPADSVAQRMNHGQRNFEIVNTHPTALIQRKVTRFKTTNTVVKSPVEQYMSNTDASIFSKNAHYENMPTALTRILPKTPKDITKVTAVSANITPNGPSTWARANYASSVVGHAGSQEATLTTGSASYYQGGHLISHSLLGRGTGGSTADKVNGFTNLVPMESALNNMTYKKLETQVAKNTGVSAVDIDVTPNLFGFVSHENVEKITVCITTKPETGTYITPVNTRAVGVSVGGSSIGKAEEIDAIAPHERMIKTGRHLVQHLENIGAIPWVAQTLLTKLNLIT